MRAHGARARVVHNRGARHHESADNDHGGVSEANDSCWQQNPPEVQQNSSKWSQRIGWTVSTSTQVRWGTEFVHPHGADHGPRIDRHPGCRHRHGHELGSSLSPSSVNREAEVSQLMLAGRESPLRMRRSPTTSEFLHPTRLLRSSRVRIFSYSRTSNMCCVWTPPSGAKPRVTPARSGRPAPRRAADRRPGSRGSHVRRQARRSLSCTLRHLRR